MKYLKITTAILAALSVSACSGGGGKSVMAPAPATALEKGNYIIDTVQTIAEKVDAGELTDNFDVPTTGTANYTGVIAFEHGTDDVLAGNLEMGVDFATADVSGTADNFVNTLDETWSGNLDIAGNFATVVGVTGTLTSEGGVDTTIRASADNHTNVGSTAGGEQTPEYILGTLAGTSTTGSDVIVLDETNSVYIGKLTD